MSTTIGASLVKELRDLTGAGMMDCKRALEETGGDLESARVLLRERGMASAGKRAGRTTTEGLVGFILDGSTGSIAGIGCETEPVSKNEEFLAFAEAVLRAIHAEGPEAVESFEQERAELIAKLGENIVVVGAERFDAPDGNVVAGYAHPPANKIGVLVELNGGSPELARQLAMHISFAAPEWTTRDDVPVETWSRPSEASSLNSDEVQSKPEAARERSWTACSPSASSPPRPVAYWSTSPGFTTRRRRSARRSTTQARPSPGSRGSRSRGDNARLRLAFGETMFPPRAPFFVSGPPGSPPLHAHRPDGR